MTAALADIEFLARSDHRVAALETLIETPHDRAGLREAIDASSSTIGRVLGEFTERGWITRVNHQYEATPLGELVGREFVRLLDTMEAVEDLHEAIAWLPTETMDFDLGALRDANVTTATKSNPFLPITTISGRLSAANRVQMLSQAALPQALAAVREAVVNDSQTFEAVLTRDVLDAVGTDPTMQAQAEDLIESDRARLFEHEEDIPYNMTIADGTVMIVVINDRELPHALIRTDNETVLSWAESTYNSYRCASSPVESPQPAR